MENKMILNPRISAGELVDKWTILMIKQLMLTDMKALANVSLEMGEINKSMSVLMDGMPSDCTAGIFEAMTDLAAVNKRLWVIEDQIRELHKAGDHGEGFVQLATDVFKVNKQRSDLKRRVNELTESEIIEEKMYAGE